VVPSPITYEYYVCNRCGTETSKSVIRQVGAYLECPKCNFSFSRAEAVVIQKAAPGSERSTKSGQEETTKPFDIYASKQPGEDESLVRPSFLFADREKESEVAMKRVAPARVAEGGRPKPRAVPTDRLVRPSEFLGLKDDQVPTDQAITTAKKPAEKPVSEAEKIVKHEASEYFGDQEPSSSASRPASADTQKIAQAPASEYFVEETPDHPAWKKGPEAPLKVAPEANTPLSAAVTEPPAPGDACPKCGSSKYSKIQDRSKIISYNPLMYGYKKKCTMCSHEFD
jgi:DNA-directed RNA polymerase subunit RPC12/RpoP